VPYALYHAGYGFHEDGLKVLPGCTTFFPQQNIRLHVICIPDISLSAGWEIGSSKFAWAEEQPSSEPKTDGPVMDRSWGSSYGDKVSQPIRNHR
jgi:hypothetical protein